MEASASTAAPHGVWTSTHTHTHTHTRAAYAEHREASASHASLYISADIMSQAMLLHGTLTLQEES